LEQATFDGAAFVAALDAQRQARKITWKKVAEESQVSASTLTRLTQGRRPDVDSFAALCSWSGLHADLFLKGHQKQSYAEPLANITAYLRADPNLSVEGAAALEVLIKTAYERLRT
jgi:transcriptional regulator with XRE-family HTH domain